MGNGERVDACLSTASRVLSARLASPCACRTSNSSASSASSTFPLSPFPFPTSCNARSITTRMWASVRGSNTNTRQRESSGAVSSKLGFSVVAPISVMIGATTENPSFELTAPLLSRCRVFVFEPLTDAHMRVVIERALHEVGKGNGERGKVELAEEALELLVRHAQGDARRALNTLEAVLKHASTLSPFPIPLSPELVQSVLERPLPAYDKSGEQHFNLISALHKAVRGSDVEGSLYWLARMLAGGEDPLYLARRLVRIAAEDVGLADPRAMTLALAAKDAYHFLGSPEGELALAEAVVYLATAPKSNRVYTAFAQAMEAAAAHPTEAVPLHIRNAPTKLMEELGYGAGYQYAHAFEHAYIPQEYLPEVLRGASWYQPTAAGYEKTIGERMEFWKQLKEKLLRDAGSGRREA